MEARGMEGVLGSEARLQELVPDAVLVGGSAAVHHAAHRVSLDDDRVVRDLRDRFDDVLADLEATEGPRPARRGFAVNHRHLETVSGTPPEAQPLAAIVDILQRGDLEEWRPIARATRPLSVSGDGTTPRRVDGADRNP